LLLTAAEPLGDSALLSRAADRLGIKAEAADAAESEGLVEFCVQVTCRHPLVRSAIYRSASPEQRREAHQALAEATDPELDPDRRAWHFAQAAPGPDEGVASELERCAERAQARGGLAAAAAFLERSAALTLEPGRRAARALAAARVMVQSGAFEAALRLLATAEAGPLDKLQRAWAELLRGQIAFASGRSSEASPLLLKAATSFEPLDVGLARQTYLEAFSAAQYAGRFGTGAGLREAAQAARAAPRPAQPPSAPDLLLDGLALLNTEGYTGAAPTLKRALSAFSSEQTSTEEALRWLGLASRTAVRLWDAEGWDVLTTRYVRLARETRRARRSADRTESTRRTACVRRRLRRCRCASRRGGPDHGGDGQRTPALHFASPRRIRRPGARAFRADQGQHERDGASPAASGTDPA